jgi:hypothetical protein
VAVSCSTPTPTPTIVAYHTQTGLDATGASNNDWFNSWSAPDSGTAPNTGVSTINGNLLVMWGFVRPLSTGVLQLRFAPKTATANGVIIKAGSTLEYW